MADTDKIFDDAEAYRNYFKDDEDALNAVIGRLEKIQSISDGQIEKIAEISQQGTASARGTQHYLIEHITNAIQIQSQMQSVLKDKRSIKESALQMALKKMGGEENTSDAKDILASLTTVISEMKKKNESATTRLENAVNNTVLSDEENEKLDEEIKRKLEEN